MQFFMLLFLLFLPLTSQGAQSQSASQQQMPFMNGGIDDLSASFRSLYKSMFDTNQGKQRKLQRKIFVS